MTVRYNSNPRMLSPSAKAKQSSIGIERHTIDRVSYQSNELECSCGEWRGPALDLEPFRLHRRDAGMRAR
jgi:hypothetical protein